MKTKPTPRWIFVYVLATLFSAQAKTSTARKDAPRPNIIFVMVDDVGYGDFGYNGHPYVKTPNIDRFATEGVRLTDYQVSPTCSPTRAALLSGKLPFEVGVTHTILERERMALDVETVAESLQKAGYSTGIFGKWHLGDEAPYQPDQRGFDEVFMHGGGGIGQAFQGSCADVPGNKYFDPVILHNGTFVKTHGFCTDVFFRQALGWMKTRKKTGKPFFMYLSTNAAHQPYVAPEKYMPYYLKHSKDQKTAAFYGMIENIDDNMGLLLKKIDEWELAKNTVVIFTSDNGTAHGDYTAGLKGRKGSTHEGGTRVPCFIRWPKHFPADTEMSHLTRHVDMFPTFAALAGAETPNNLDGRNLLPWLENPQAPWKDRVTFFHGGRWGKKGVVLSWCPDISSNPEDFKTQGFAVRTDQWRLTGLRELYDIRADRGEKNNVFKEHPEVAQKLTHAYLKWWDQVQPRMLINENASLDVEKYHVRYKKQQKEQGIPDWVPPAL